MRLLTTTTLQLAVPLLLLATSPARAQAGGAIPTPGAPVVIPRPVDPHQEPSGVPSGVVAVPPLTSATAIATAMATATTTTLTSSSASATQTPTVVVMDTGSSSQATLTTISTATPTMGAGAAAATNGGTSRHRAPVAAGLVMAVIVSAGLI
ncbi:uncharacterized protein EV422DRAFT_521415 [Fimicolochytrium jonesii]|uniref:uncharacterized protein n=1 Tax=Fimicolochytrium jonesii TaxID=1396493 RepID=UPI0022FE5171|nr:uncharacterized protein EV422DRAFT_521415 [Fimicolochytrium jonesii]KAI8823550.1 hypothetical protein EV422DRAFT_521415 [Fimicolochytrium jonesii]